MPVETFSAAEFSEALPHVQGATWEDVGNIQGERCFVLRFNDRAAGVLVRSSVRGDGVSADCGEDSIRCLLMQNADILDAPGVKLGRTYVTRVKGWQGRLAALVGKMADMVRRAGPCPLCAADLHVNTSKQAETKGRPFCRCATERCPWFEWLDEAPRPRPTAQDVARAATVAERQAEREIDGDGELDDAQESAPACDCGKPARARRVVKPGPNQGKIFYGCDRPRADQCRFFAWHGKPAPVAPAARAAAPVQAGNVQADDGRDVELEQARQHASAAPCPKCGAHGTRQAWRVSKPGPNNGRLFVKCKADKCGAFDWLNAAPVQADSIDARRERITRAAAPCDCGRARRCNVVGKPGPNNGRLFISCTERGCKEKSAFAWVNPQTPGFAADGATTAPASVQASAAAPVQADDGGADPELECAREFAPPCDCGGKLNIHRSKQEKSRGKMFSKCAECGAFAWLSDATA